jgi:hypothetical protein
MGKPSKFRARAEMLLAGVVGALAVATWFWPTWLESLTGLEPDAGSGETEWWLVAVFGVCAVAFSLLARRDYRIAVANRARPAEDEA